MTRQAVAEQVDLVIGAGGDGTIRYVADGLAHSGIPLGLVPAGTGNLLARNLNLPLEEVEAVEVALSGDRQVDLVKITVDDRPPEHFAVMAGIGIDAMIMDETDEDLKDKVGSAAYFVALPQGLGRLPVRLKVQLDNNRPVRRYAMLCVIGNVGTLRGNLILIPGASPDDGLLDLYIASPADSGIGSSSLYGSSPVAPRRMIRSISARKERADRHRREGQLPARRRRCRGVHHSLRRDPTGCPDHLRACPSRQRAASVTGLPDHAGGRDTIRPGQAAHGKTQTCGLLISCSHPRQVGADRARPRVSTHLRTVATGPCNLR